MIDLKSINEQIIKDNDEYIDLSSVNTTQIINFLNDVKNLLFPKIGDKSVSIENCYKELITILKNTNNDNVEEIAEAFFNDLPSIKDILLTDIQAFLQGDPACKGKEEVIFTYLSFFAIFTYRIAHELAINNVKLVPRFLTEHAHSITGIDINPNATIGTHFFIDHGTGIVIGETTIIGHHVRLYQGVTLGAISLKDAPSLKGVKRHPTIKDYVTIYANATILGGETIIGSNSTIGASCFITKSVKDNSKVSFGL